MSKNTPQKPINMDAIWKKSLLDGTHAEGWNGVDPEDRQANASRIIEQMALEEKIRGIRSQMKVSREEFDFLSENKPEDIPRLTAELKIIKAPLSGLLQEHAKMVEFSQTVFDAGMAEHKAQMALFNEWIALEEEALEIQDGMVTALEKRAAAGEKLPQADLDAAEYKRVLAKVIDKHDKQGLLDKIKSDEPIAPATPEEEATLERLMEEHNRETARKRFVVAKSITPTQTIQAPIAPAPTTAPTILFAIRGKEDQAGEEPEVMPKNDDFKLLQDALVKAGYPVGENKDGTPMIDGKEGPLSRKAIEAFVKDHRSEHDINPREISIQEMTKHIEEASLAAKNKITHETTSAPKYETTGLDGKKKPMEGPARTLHDVVKTPDGGAVELDREEYTLTLGGKSPANYYNNQSNNQCDIYTEVDFAKILEAQAQAQIAQSTPNNDASLPLNGPGPAPNSTLGA